MIEFLSSCCFIFFRFVSLICVLLFFFTLFFINYKVNRGTKNEIKRHWEHNRNSNNDQHRYDLWNNKQCKQIKFLIDIDVTNNAQTYTYTRKTVMISTKISLQNRILLRFRLHRTRRWFSSFFFITFYHIQWTLNTKHCVKHAKHT